MLEKLEPRRSGIRTPLWMPVNVFMMEHPVEIQKEHVLPISPWQPGYSVREEGRSAHFGDRLLIDGVGSMEAPTAL
jgi:hypothetical protein